jgi:hypothetical protein
MRRLTKSVFLLTLVALPVGLLAQGRSNTPPPQGIPNNPAQGRSNTPPPQGIPNNPKNPVSVPEPATLLLLGAGAAALGLRKLWQSRR